MNSTVRVLQQSGIGVMSREVLETKGHVSSEIKGPKDEEKVSLAAVADDGDALPDSTPMTVLGGARDC
jgi:hypothetical protein